MTIKCFTRKLLSAFIAVSMIISVFAGITVESFAQSTVATEVVYCGQTLNSNTPYLVLKNVTGGGIEIYARANDVLAGGETLLAHFDHTTGTFTYKSGMMIIPDENGYEEDFGWNTFFEVTQIGNDYYGIKANGDLTVDLGKYNNFIYCNWNKIFTCNLYGIYAEGDVTIKGDGFLKIPATLAMTNDGKNGDANAEPHYSYGIYAKGDVTLMSGTITVFSKTLYNPYIGNNANSTCVYAEGNIALRGTTVKVRYEEANGRGVINHFSKDPVGIENYVKSAIKNIKMNGGQYSSLGFCYVDELVTNNNCYDYFIPRDIEGMYISRNFARIEKGEKITLSAKAFPYEIANPTINWTTSDPKVATVSGGEVKGIAKGTAIIKATAAGGVHRAECVIEVTDDAALSKVSVERIELDRTEFDLSKGNSRVVTATVYPVNAIDKTVKWISSNEEVATVENGVITAVAPGSATIIATTVDGGYTDSCVVNVVGANKPATEVIYGGSTMNAEKPYLVAKEVSGQGLVYEARATADLASGEDLLAEFDAITGTLVYTSGKRLVTAPEGAEPDFIWNSYANAVQIGDDYYGIKANGDIVIDLGGFNNFIYCNWNKLFDCNLYGIYAEGDVTIKGSGYLKLPVTFAMNLNTENGDGDAVHYSYGIYAEGDVNLDGGKITFYSKPYDNEQVGSNANSVGIYAAGDIKQKSTTLKFRYEENIGQGKIKHFSKTPLGAENYEKIPVTNINMSGSYGSLGFCYVVENAANNNSFDYRRLLETGGISLDNDIIVLNVNGNENISAAITPDDAANKDVIWTSSNEIVATVLNGSITANAPGVATITATTVSGGFSDSCRVVVVENANIKLIVDGQEKPLTTPIKAYGTDDVYVPLVETFRLLGVEMTSPTDGTYVGYGNNGEIIVRLGSETAEIDWVEIELPSPVISVDGVAMVPAYLIEDALKTSPAVYNSGAGTLSVTSPDPNDVFYGDSRGDVGEIMKTLPSGTTVYTQSNILSGLRSGSDSSNLKATEVQVSINGAQSKALQLETIALQGSVRQPGEEIKYSYRTSARRTISAGATGVIRFKARTIDSAKDTKGGKITVAYERSNDKARLIQKDIVLRCNEWMEYYIPFVATGDYSIFRSALFFVTTEEAQTVQIADFTMIYYGDAVAIETLDPYVGSYHGVEEDALWRKEALRRVEKHRKEDVAVTVVDQSGKPVEGAEITVKQTESEFMFGVEVCYDEILDIDLTTQLGRLMNDAFNSFNMAVCGLEMKMEKVAYSDGVRGMNMADEFFNRGLRLRGHAVLWDSEQMNVMSPTGNYKDLTYEELYRRVMDYVEPYVYAYKGKLAQWDVLNEISQWNYIRTHFDTTQLYVDVLNAVHRIDPDVKLYVNEYNTEGKDKGQDEYVVEGLVDLIKRLKEEGGHVDGIGLQTHANNYHYPQGLYSQIDECAQVVDEVAITEYDFGHTYAEDKPQYLADNLLATFSHPQSSAFIVWGYHALASMPKKDFLYDANWNETEFKEIWDRMVNEDFKTNISVVSDNNGRADFRGYHGDYEITVSYGGVEKTFDFGVLKNGVNEINITVGGEIRADVSSGKYIVVPEKVDNKSVTDAEHNYRNNISSIPYREVLLEENLNGDVKSGVVSLSSGDYTNGNAWGSATGMSDVAKDSPEKRGMALSNSGSGSYIMNHLYSGEVYEQGNLEMSVFVETTGSRRDGFSLDLGFMNSQKTANLGGVRTSTQGYFLETLAGRKFHLADNTIYEIQISLMATGYPGVYDVKYTVKKDNQPQFEIIEEQKALTSVTDLKGISLTVTSDGRDYSDVLIVRLARVIFFTEGVYEFENLSNDAEIISDTMYDFNMDEVVSDADADYLEGKAWGTNTDNAREYFKYYHETHHVYGVRTAPDGEKTLKHKMVSPTSGEALDVEFDFYIATPQNAYDSPYYFEVRLENADGSLSRTLARCDSGTLLKLLENAEGTFGAENTVEHNDVVGITTFNKNNLRILCKLTPNASGDYDATLTLKNHKSETVTATVENFITGAEFAEIDTFTIASETTAAGIRYGNGVAGVKNVRVTKTGKAEVYEGDLMAFEEGDVVGIRYENPTKRPMDAQMMLVRYVDDKFSSVDVYTFDDLKKEEGYLSIPVSKKSADENKFMIMLVDGEGNMKPLKAAEDIVIY